MGDAAGRAREVGLFHLVCYLRAGDMVFETYWTKGRGVEAMDNNYGLIDLTAYGRQEPSEDSPAGWPQPWGVEGDQHPYRTTDSVRRVLLIDDLIVVALLLFAQRASGAQRRSPASLAFLEHVVHGFCKRRNVESLGNETAHAHGFHGPRDRTRG